MRSRIERLIVVLAVAAGACRGERGGPPGEGAGRGSRARHAMSQAPGITPRAQDFSAWYNDAVLRAELADYSPVRGCMVIRPNGYAIWELMVRALDDMFKATGHKN